MEPEDLAERLILQIGSFGRWQVRLSSWCSPAKTESASDSTASKRMISKIAVGQGLKAVEERALTGPGRPQYDDSAHPTSDAVEGCRQPIAFLVPSNSSSTGQP